MAKVKRIVELDEKLINHLIRGGLNPSMVISNFDLDIADAIRDSKPYDDSGDLISRSTLKNYWENRILKDCSYISSEEILQSIDDATTVEPPFKIVGHYEIKRPQGEWIKCGWSIRCSVCNYDMPYTVRNFCPNCGAEMSKETRND